MLRSVEPDEYLGSVLESADDGFLVARALDGDLRGFTALLQRYSAVLRRYVDRITRNRSDTDDVLQDVFVIAWQQLPALRQPEQVRTWLIRIASREAIRHVAAKPVHDPVTDDLATVPGPEHDLERLDRNLALRDALDTLPQQQARVWVLRELGGYSYDEIATDLNIPASTVRGALVQARKRILHAMGGTR